jgi:MFS family permease
VGALVDRWDRRRMMILADTGAGVVTLTLALLFFSGRLAVWHIYAAIFMSSACSSFQWPAYSAATTLLVPKKHLARAGGMVQMGQSLSRLLTPAIAGALFATGGLGSLILIDFVNFLFAVATLLLIRIPRPTRSAVGTAVKGSLLREGVYGWTYIKARPGLMGLLLAGASWNLLWGIANAVLVPMILELYSPDVAGYISSVIGAGLLTGTLVMSIWGGPQRLILGALVPLVASGLFAILLGLRPSLVLIVIGSFGVHLAVPLYSASSQAIWQRKVQPDLQGRVFAARRKSF